MNGGSSVAPNRLEPSSRILHAASRPRGSASEPVRSSEPGDSNSPPRSGLESLFEPMDVQGSYDRVAREYGERIAGELQHKPLDREILARLADRLRGRGTVCDVGCGPGHVAAHLLALGLQTVGIDLSAGMVAEARRRFPGLDFRVGDMRTLVSPAGGWAGIVAMYSIIHVPPSELPGLFRTFRERLAPGGLLLLAFHLGDGPIHADEWWGVAVDLDFRFFALAVVEDALRSVGFQVEESQERDPYAGVEHPSRRGYVLARAPDGTELAPRREGDVPN